jgi:hypothetical protein
MEASLPQGDTAYIAPPALSCGKVVLNFVPPVGWRLRLSPGEPGNPVLLYCNNELVAVASVESEAIFTEDGWKLRAVKDASTPES